MSKLTIIFVLFSLNILFLSTSFAEGALVIGKDGRGQGATITVDHLTAEDAWNSAMASCRSRMPDCRVVHSFRNSCVALVRSRLPDGRKGYVWAGGASRSDAENRAMQRCWSQGGVCELANGRCDTIDAQLAESRKREEQKRAAAEAQWRKEQEEKYRAAEHAERQRLEAELAAKSNALSEREKRIMAAEQDVRRQQYQAALGSQIDQVAEKLLPVAVILALAALSVLIVAIRKELPISVKIIVALFGPVLTTALYYYFGFTNEVTLAEVSILLLPFGSSIAFALLYKNFA